ncbi:hypothetical protein A2U01_0115478, partial [Trifolium medium]|nr:hypothetical protein [Trifolium medium]
IIISLGRGFSNRVNINKGV